MGKHVTLALLLSLVLFGCVQKPAPVATEQNKPADPAERYAIAVEYVGVPSMKIYAQPADTAAITGSYAYMEAISVLDRKGDWREIRTFEGTGWVKAADLMDHVKATSLENELSKPRFFKEPAKVPYGGRGELVFQLRIDTDGQVVDVLTKGNTTGSTTIEKENIAAIKQAVFYPLVDKGQRKYFTYEHHVYY